MKEWHRGFWEFSGRCGELQIREQQKRMRSFFVVSLGSREIRESAASQLHRSSRRDNRADMFLRSKLEARVHLDTQLLLLQDAGKDGH